MYITTILPWRHVQRFIASFLSFHNTMGYTQQPRQLYIMRHAERVDFTFGKTWMSSSFDDKGNYIRTDLNMPLTVPKRNAGPKDFATDGPLTRIGQLQATLAGEGMKLGGVTFSHIFSSPALRCIETCTNVLKASGQEHLPIKVEPGLFEWLKWYVDGYLVGMPKFLSLEEFKENGFNVALDYTPLMSIEDLLATKESCEEFYRRNFMVASTILKEYSGNILMVGHSSTLDTCSRQLVGKEPRNEKDWMNLVTNISYAAVAVVELTSDSSWKLVDPPLPPLTHSNNKGFQWKSLLD